MFVELGISWAQMPVNELEAALRLIAKDDYAELLHEIRQCGIRQYILLQTCNRFEIYFFLDNNEYAFNDQNPSQKLRTAFAQIARLDGNSPEARSDAAALVHLTRLAAGLESKFFGEYQILGQIKDAHRRALENGNCAGRLDCIFRNAITIAKKVRTSLDLGAVAPSVCEAGVALLEEKAGGFGGKGIFIVGSGRTGSLAARLVHERGAGSIAVCNRSPERTERIVRELNAKAIEYKNRYDEILDSDIVISATSSPHVVIENSKLGNLAKPTAFLDLAMPRDIDEAVAQRKNALVLDLSSVDALAKRTTEERERLSAFAMKTIEESLKETFAQ